MSIFIDPTRIPIIVGATGVGKTKLSIQLAEKYGFCILSADSMQVYREMDIGTAKVSMEIRKRIPHYLVDILNPDEPWSLHHFLETAKPLFESNPKMIVVGGTGLYIRALIQGFQMPASITDPVLREKLKERANIEGLSSLYRELIEKDPDSGSIIKENDAFRIIRALEIIEQTGKKPSESKLQNPQTDRFQLIVLNRPRDIIYQRINDRVDQMIEDGLVNEVQRLLDRGYSRELTSLQGLGYKEIISFLNNDISLSEAVDLIKQRSRHFAKRQLTWYRSFPDAEWIDLEGD